jgi:UDP-glucose 4-epimerase
VPDYLITGGAGFIGSHLADALIARGDGVIVLDNLSTGSLGNIAHLLDRPRVSFYEGSILKQDVVKELVSRSDGVVHLAASVGVRLVIERPLESLINNIRGTEIVLEVCAEFGRKVLVASTSEIYGKNGHEPLAEDADRILGSPFKARWSYGTSKAVDEILAYTYWRERGTPSIVVRLFNTVGPRQIGTYGMVVPTFVRQALLGVPITVYGDGEQRRCFCHVQDTVAALLGLLDHPKSFGEVFNVGSEHEVTINELAGLIVEATGSASHVTHIPYDIAYQDGFEDILRRVPNTTKLRTLTGWVPTHSLKQIIADVIEDTARKLNPAGQQGRSKVQRR